MVIFASSDVILPLETIAKLVVKKRTKKIVSPTSDFTTTAPKFSDVVSDVVEIPTKLVVKKRTKNIVSPTSEFATSAPDSTDLMSDVVEIHTKSVEKIPTKLKQTASTESELKELEDIATRKIVCMLL